MVRLGGISRFPLYHLHLFVLSNVEGEILARRKCIVPSARQFCSEAAVPHRRSDRMDSPPRQFLSAGNYYLPTLFRATRSMCDWPSPLQRAVKAGGDSRFDQVKRQPGTFLAFWMAQGLFVDSFSLRVSHTYSVVGPCYWPPSLSRTFHCTRVFWHEERFSRTGECGPPAHSPRLIRPGLRFPWFICWCSSLRDYRRSSESCMASCAREQGTRGKIHYEWAVEHQPPSKVPL